jgi:hypothetical protein
MGHSSASGRPVAAATLASARSIVRMLPASVPSGRRTAPSRIVNHPIVDGILPLGHARAANGIGHQDDAFRSLDLHQDVDHGRMDVQVVGDQLAANLGQGHRRADRAQLSVTEANHGVKAVGHLPQAKRHSALHGSS